MLSNKSLKNLKYILSTAQVLQCFGLYYLPFQWDHKKETIKLVPNLGLWQMHEIFWMFGAVYGIIGITLSLFIFTERDSINTVGAAWNLTLLTALLAFQIHLYRHYPEIFQMFKNFIRMNKRLSKLRVKIVHLS